ncbi:trypsin-like serine protease [Kutzneria viridogrisea]|uniref:Trypsin-like serine protease n=2 Tax=Kutzneria TaxID=43356 RepID=W5WF00_9PSEU|nr:trypsin-like serine protease [Kutzneria albida]AHH96734.1 trypsin-like serine protease [Kutzneria albida DSM 43870]MBA8928047.1 secreted trypsin-like serine protease [Kutzneria viridogrisea]
MRKSVVAAVLAGAALATGLLGGTAQASTASPSIIGGGSASNAPWGAQIYWTNSGSSDGFECSGSIIAPQWVLTAQHCLNKPGMYVLVGSLNLGQGTKATVDKQYASPSGDVALLHLSSSVNASYIKLGSADPAVGSTNQIYGWGRTQGSNPPSPVLKTANVKVTGSSTDAFGGKAIASKGVNGAAWHGDSGGPQIANGVQVGVCSTGNNSGSNPQGTQNYASVASNRSFIKNTAGV